MVEEWSLKEAVRQAVEQSWQDFLRHMDSIYPADRVTDERLARDMAELDEHLQERLADGTYLEAADTSATIGSIGALRAARGNEAMQEHADRLRYNMTAVVLGEGPTPWMVTTTGPDGRDRWGAVQDEEINLTGLAHWSEAARYALPHYLPPHIREEFGLEPFGIARGIAHSLRPGSREPDELPDPPDWLAEEGARRQHLKEQFLSGEPDLTDIEAAYQDALLHHSPAPNADERQHPEPEPDGPEIEP